MAIADAAQAQSYSEAIADRDDKQAQISTLTAQLAQTERVITTRLEQLGRLVDTDRPARAFTLADGRVCVVVFSGAANKPSVLFLTPET